MEIQAAIVRSPGRFVIESVQLDDPQPGEVLVKIVATGLCHTDLAVRDQHLPLPLPAILGHEGAGHVVAVGGGVTSFAPGDPVVLSFAFCGRCGACLAGRPAYCAHFIALNVGGCRPDGTCTHHQHGRTLTSSFFGQSSFATHALVSERNIVRVASDLPLAMLGPLGCGLQTGAGAVLNVLRPAPGASIAIFGLGAVGLSAVMAAKIANCDPIVAVDVVPSRLDLARDLGATLCVAAKDGHAAETIQQSTGGVDYAIEATGLPSVMSQAFDALHATGTAVVLGVAAPGAGVTVSAAGLLGGKTLKGAIEGDSIPAVFIPKLIGYYRAGLFPFDRLIRVYDLADINQAAMDSENGATIKAVILMSV